MASYFWGLGIGLITGAILAWPMHQDRAKIENFSVIVNIACQGQQSNPDLWLSYYKEGLITLEQYKACVKENK